MRPISRARLFQLTRDPQFLWRTVAAILVFSGILAYAASLWAPKTPSLDPDDLFGLISDDTANAPTLRLLFANGSIDANIRTLFALSESAISKLPPELTDALKNNSKLTQEQKTILSLAWKSAASGQLDPELEKLAQQASPPRYARMGLARAVAPTDRRRAANLLEAEGRAFPEAKFARREAVQAYADIGDREAALRLLEDPAFVRVTDPDLANKLAADQHDWLGMVRMIWIREFSERSILTVALVIISGLIWFTIASHMGRANEDPIRLAYYGLSFVLGFLSTTPVLILGFLQEYWRGFRETGEIVGDLIYFILSVGLREEVLKLLFFLPVAFLILRRRNPLEMLICPAMAGLGFAVSENLNYFDRGGVDATLGRFLSANFLHLAFTGIAGLALCNALSNERKGWEEFLSKFIFVILLHGVYDTLLSDYFGRDGSFFASMALVYIGYLFFQDLHKVRPVGNDPFSVLATFSLGSAVLIGVSLIAASYEIGFAKGLSITGTAALSYAVLNILFVREFQRM